MKYTKREMLDVCDSIRERLKLNQFPETGIYHPKPETYEEFCAKRKPYMDKLLRYLEAQAKEQGRKDRSDKIKFISILIFVSCIMAIETIQISIGFYLIAVVITAVCIGSLFWFIDKMFKD